MHKDKLHFIIFLVVALLIAVTAVVSRIYYNTPTAESSAIIEEQKYYVIADEGGNELLHAVIYAGKDTVISDVHDSAFIKTVTRIRPASWVNRTWFPFSFGYLTCKIDKVAEQKGEMPSLDSLSIPALLDRKVDLMKVLSETFTTQLSEIDYYLNSHSMQDEGFDIVVRRREAVLSLRDSVINLQKVVEECSKTKKFSVVLRTHNTVVSGKSRFPVHEMNGRKEGYKLFRTEDGQMPEHVRAVYVNAENIGYGMNTAKSLSPLKDTVYIGKRDRRGVYTGTVRMVCRNGSYYEGEVRDTIFPGTKNVHTLRHGVGVGFDHERVSAGLWKNDLYKGEQPLYTSNHVYGIDISRYQHEPAGAKTVTKTKKVKVRGRWRNVRVRQKVSYPIDWKNLRITSLGSKSKKRIDGIVDYPVSFVYIKSTEGSSLTNKYYIGDYNSARRHGYKVGSYHFFSTRTDAVAQATFFIRSSRYTSGDLPPVLDLEPTSAQIRAMGGPDAMLSSVRKWLEVVEKHRNVRPILYVSQNFVNKYFNSQHKNGEYLKKNYQVWIARYGEYKPDVHLLFWQLCPDGIVQGIHGHTDINIYNGYADSFKDSF